MHPAQESLADCVVAQSNEAFLGAKTQIAAASILEGLGDAVIFVDAELRVVYLNEAAQVQYGVDREAAIGQRLDALYEWVWEDPAHEHETYDGLNRSGAWRGLNRHKLKDGRELVVESTVRLPLTHALHRA